MRDPSTGEKAYALTGAQIDATRLIAACTCGAHYIPKLGTAVALVNRQMVEPVPWSAALGPKTLYRLTDRGRAALRRVPPLERVRECRERA